MQLHSAIPRNPIPSLQGPSHIGSAGRGKGGETGGQGGGGGGAGMGGLVL